MALAGRIEGVWDGVLRGWLWDSDQPRLRCTAQLLIDENPLGTILADRPRGDLQRNGMGDGMHGFEHALPLEIQDGLPHLIQLRCADAPGEAGQGRFEKILEIELRKHLLQGRVERIARGRILGWVWNRAQPEATVTVELWCGETLLATTRASQFRTDLMRAGIGVGANGFAFDLGRLAGAVAPGDVLEVRASEDLGRWRVGAIAAPDMAAMTAAADAPEAEPMMVRAAPPAAARASNSAAKASNSAARASTSAAGAATRIPVDTRALLQSARQAEASRDFAAAAGLLDTALATARRDFDLLFTRARVAIALQDFETGERYARAALQERPGHIRPTVLLARIAHSTGRHEESATLWAEVPPGDAAWRERLVKRSRSLLLLSRTMEAMAELAELARFDPLDREALRGVAEAVEAAGARRSALQHWRRYVAVAADDRTAIDHIAALERSLAPPGGLASPLRDPWLRHWNGPVEGEAAPEGTRLAPWLFLRGLGASQDPLRYAVGAARERQPGELPFYGIWLGGARDGFQLLFGLDPAAANLLDRGLLMSIELHGTSGPLEDAIPVDLGVVAAEDGGQRRSLLRWRVGSRPRLARFELRLDEAELAKLSQGLLWLDILVPAAAGLLVMPPQPVAPLHAPKAGSVGFEVEGFAAHLAALGLPSAASSEGPDVAAGSGAATPGADGDPARHLLSA